MIEDETLSEDETPTLGPPGLWIATPAGQRRALANVDQVVEGHGRPQQEAQQARRYEALAPAQETEYSPRDCELEL